MNYLKECQLIIDSYDTQEIIKSNLQLSNPFSIKFSTYSKYSSKISLSKDFSSYTSRQSYNKSKSILYNRIVIDKVDILTSSNYPDTKFYLLKTDFEDSTMLLFNLSDEKIKEKIEEKNNIYSICNEIQKVTILYRI